MLRSSLRSFPNVPPCPACISQTRRLLYSPRKTNATALDSFPATLAPILASTPAQSTSRRPRARKAALELSPSAVSHITSLLASSAPQLLRIGVKNAGCAGLTYKLEYVKEPARFDEVVEQDRVKVIIDSKALFSIIGSRMDWEEGPLGAKFTFKNPNVKDACGCGESFTV